jgi:hypothetical protein
MRRGEFLSGVFSGVVGPTGGRKKSGPEGPPESLQKVMSKN